MSSDWSLLHHELSRTRQILTNNGYSMVEIDKEIHDRMGKYNEKFDRQTSTKNPIDVYYQNTYSSSYKKDEKVLREIVHRNCKPRDQDDFLNLIIFYRSPRTSSLVMRNNMSGTKDKLKQSCLVYKYSCGFNKDGVPCNKEYIGYTTQSLSQRLTFHMQNGAIKSHWKRTHNTDLTREELNNNTTILAKESNKTRLICLEAVCIRNHLPAINIQMNMCGTLELFGASHRAPLN